MDFLDHELFTCPAPKSMSQAAVRTTDQSVTTDQSSTTDQSAALVDSTYISVGPGHSTSSFSSSMGTAQQLAPPPAVSRPVWISLLISSMPGQSVTNSDHCQQKQLPVLMCAFSESNEWAFLPMVCAVCKEHHLHRPQPITCCTIRLGLLSDVLMCAELPHNTTHQKQVERAASFGSDKH